MNLTECDRKNVTEFSVSECDRKKEMFDAHKQKLYSTIANKVSSSAPVHLIVKRQTVFVSRYKHLEHFQF